MRHARISLLIQSCASAHVKQRFAKHLKKGFEHFALLIAVRQVHDRLHLKKAVL